MTRRGRKVNVPRHLTEYEVYTAYCLISTSEEDPVDYNQAIKQQEWKQAIEKELNSHKLINTWTEAELPKGKRAIQTKWVFKTKEDGTKKARLVAKGFQIKEDNPFETIYSPVARMSTIRLILSIALQENWDVMQLDIPTAFLNGEMKHETYIYIPEGLTCKSPVLRLNRALYGLKESPKVWNETFNEFALKNNFRRSQHDCCLYSNGRTWMLIYVDDILVIGKSVNVKEILLLLEKQFRARILGQINHFLGMEVIRLEDKIEIRQTKFIDKLISYFNMETCNPKKTPMEKGFHNTEEEIIKVPYRQLIGGLLYLSTTSRPDITYAVGYLSRYLDKPTAQLWNAGKRILRYLKGTKDIGLKYFKNKEANKTLNGYTDADWATDKSDRKSVSGCLIFYGNNPISWFSKKQSCVALSTAEAEYVAAAACAQDLVNLKGILSDFRLDNKTILYCDNRSSILMAKSNENSKRAKHIDIKAHFIKELVACNEIEIRYVSTDQNLADILTKALPEETFVNLRNNSYIM